MRHTHAARREERRIVEPRPIDRLVLAALILSGIALLLVDAYQPLSASVAQASPTRFSSTDLALPRFLRAVNPDHSSFSLALLPQVRQSPDRAWGGRSGDLDFERVRIQSGADEFLGDRGVPVSEAAFRIADQEEGIEGGSSRSREGVITSGFGFRRLGGTVRHHDGIDISMPYGSAIQAHDAGVVSFAGWRNGYGLTVIIDHGNGKQTLYAHASSLRVREGQSVGKGEVIAAVGTTGRAYGAHLHFEIRYNDVPIDPEREYLEHRH